MLSATFPSEFPIITPFRARCLGHYTIKVNVNPAILASELNALIASDKYQADAITNGTLCVSTIIDFNIVSMQISVLMSSDDIAHVEFVPISHDREEFYKAYCDFYSQIPSFPQVTQTPELLLSPLPNLSDYFTSEQFDEIRQDTRLCINAAKESLMSNFLDCKQYGINFAINFKNELEYRNDYIEFVNLTISSLSLLSRCEANLYPALHLINDALSIISSDNLLNNLNDEIIKIQNMKIRSKFVKQRLEQILCQIN